MDFWGQQNKWPQLGVRLENISKSLKGTKYRVQVIDTEYSGAVEQINLQADGVVFRTNGDSRDIWKPMSLSSCQVTFWLDKVALFDFYDDIAEAEESRFYLRVDRLMVNEFEEGTWNNEFRGMILVDSVSRNDETYALLKLEAIDGMAILKEIEYEWTDRWLIRPLWQIIHDCLKVNPVVKELYAANDVVVRMQSGIEVSNALFTKDLFQSVGHAFYYYTISEDVRTNWSCYDILEEICKKYMLRVSYDDGIWVMRGVDTYLNFNSLGQSTVVTKGGAVALDGNIDPTLLDATNLALAGGRYNNVKGYRQVRIEASKEGSNKYLANTDVFTVLSPQVGYYTAPPMIKNQDFDLHINFKAAMVPLPVIGNYYLLMKIRIKFTDLSNNNVFYGNIFGNIVYVPNEEYKVNNKNTEEDINVFIKYPVGQLGGNLIDTVVKFKIPAYAQDRRIEVSYDFALSENFSLGGDNPFDTGSVYWLSYSLGASPLGSASTSIPINAYVADTKNTGTYEIKIHASDMYGTTGTKAIVFDGTNFELAGNNWSVGGISGGLEKVVSTFMMKYLVKSQEQITLPISTNFNDIVWINPVAYGTIAYKSKEYFITNIEQNYLDDVILVYGVRSNTPTALAVTTNSFAPLPPSSGGQSSTSFSNTSILQSVLRPIMKEYTVTGTEVEVHDSMFLPIDSLYSSVIDSFMVIVDGVVWSVIQGFNPADRRPRAMVNLATKKIMFNRTLNNSVVKVIYTNLIIRDPNYAEA